MGCGISSCCHDESDNYGSDNRGLDCCKSEDELNKIELDKYITVDCIVKINLGSKVNIETQLRKQRIEVICIGRFLSDNPQLNVLYRDRKLPSANFRPDLVYNIDGKIYHVEIDEMNHNQYEKQNESNRYNLIKEYFIAIYGNYRLIRYNPNYHIKKFNKDDSISISDKLNIAREFSLLLNNIMGLTKFEMIETK